MTILNKIKNNMNEAHLSILWVVIAIVAGIFLAPALQLNLSEIVTLRIVKLGLFFGTIASFIYLFNGTDADVYKEIYDQHNIALAIMMAGLFWATATIISK